MGCMQMATNNKYASAIYTHTTLTNDITHINSLIGQGRGRPLSDAYITALVTGAVGTHLSDSEAPELNDIDS